jgi:hypothetical protein
VHSSLPPLLLLLLLPHHRKQVGDSPGPAALALLTRLTQLDLSCSGLGNAGLAALGTLGALQELNLDMCRVGDEGCRVSGEGFRSSGLAVMLAIFLYYQMGWRHWGHEAHCRS